MSMRKRRGYNPKRRIRPSADVGTVERTRLAADARYGGNPEHKLRPEDYGLTPPRNPRPGKTLCDGSGEVPKAEAERLLKVAFEKGMVSVQMRNNWPQNAWAVRGDLVFEAQLEDRARGSYHGYPMPQNDDFREVVLTEWAHRD